MTVTRRTLLTGAGAVSAQILLSRRLMAFAGADATGGGRLTAKPGALHLSLSALSPNLLRISISPANDGPRLSEFGVVKESGPVLAGPGQVEPTTISWGK